MDSNGKSEHLLWDRWLPMGHGLYYLLTGIWPILHPHSFQKVTGPKTDLWVVKLFGALIGVVGAAVFLAGRNRRITPEVELIALDSSASLAAGDVYYAAIRRRISPIYILESLAEWALVAAWLLRRSGSKNS